MKLALYRLASNSRGAKIAESSGASWVRFGDEVLVYGSDVESAELVLAGGRSARRLKDDSVPLKSEQMHVVVQNGRMFQREQPKVPVLVDKGRYLLVKLDPKRARQLKDANPTCFGIFPLPENEVVFDVRAAGSARAAKVDWISELVNRIKRVSFESMLTHLVSFRTRHSTRGEFKSASTWARDQFKALNYVTRFQNITVNGKPSRNVVADKAGLGVAPRKVVLVTAHLDSINHDDGPTGLAPGADDNGSGSAGALEMARVLAEHPSQHDVRFILFGGEEQGLFGSLHYVNTLSQAEKKKILSVLNMDMIGTLNSPTRSVMLEGAPLSTRMIDGLATAAATYTALKVETSLHPFASDHVPFIDAGIPAVLTIEGADNANSNIHSSRDTIDHINYDFALEILRMNIAFIANEIGRSV